MKDCLRSKKIYEYFFLLLVTNYFNSFFMNSFKSFASYSDSPISDHTLTWAASLGTIANACFRIIFGRVSDNVGFKPLYIIIMLFQILCVVLSYYFVKNTPIYFVCIMLNYLNTGASFVVMATSIAKVFGPKYGTTVLSFVLIGSLLSSALNLLSAKYIIDEDNFKLDYIICFIATFLAILIVLQFDEKLDEDRIFRKKD